MGLHYLDMGWPAARLSTLAARLSFFLLFSGSCFALREHLVPKWGFLRLKGQVDRAEYTINQHVFPVKHRKAFQLPVDSWFEC